MAESPNSEDSKPMIKKKEIVEHVAGTTELNKRQAREALEASLSFMHANLKDGQELQIPPLGKVRVIIQNDGTSREKTVYRLILQKPKSDNGPDVGLDNASQEASDDSSSE